MWVDGDWSWWLPIKLIIVGNNGGVQFRLGWDRFDCCADPRQHSFMFARPFPDQALCIWPTFTA